MKLSINEDFKQSLAKLGIDFSEIVKAANLPRLLWEDTPKLTHYEYFELLSSLDKAITDQQLILFSEIENLKMFVPPIFAAMCASNGQQSIERLAKYKSLIGPVSVTVNTDEYFTRVIFHFDYDKGLVPRVCILNEHILLVSLLRNCTGQQISPERMSCEYDYGEQIASFLGCSNIETNENLLVFKKEDLSLPFYTKNNVMWEYIEPSFIEELDQQRKPQSFSEVLEIALVNAIPSGKFSLQDISMSLGKSTRSIQRMLSVEHTTFRNQVKKAQVNLASNYLKRTNLSVEEIGYLLGYEDTSSFRRAFKKWTGKTVSEFRLARNE